MKRQRCGPGKRIVSAVIPADTYNTLHKRAQEEGVSISAYCARIIIAHCRTSVRLTIYPISETTPARVADPRADYDPHPQPLAPGCCPLARAVADGELTNKGNGEGDR